MIFDAYAQFEESVISSKMEEMSEEESNTNDGKLYRASVSFSFSRKKRNFCVKSSRKHRQRKYSATVLLDCFTYIKGGELMARVPDVGRRRFFSATPLDTLILITFDSWVFNFFYTIAPFQKLWVKVPPQSLHVRRATIFPTENR